MNNSYHHGNLREELIAEAMQTLKNQGIAAVSIRQLSKSLGVSKNAPYRHFRNKASLLTAVAAEGFKKMSNMFSNSSDAETPKSSLAIIMERYVTFAIENPELYKLMFSWEILQLPVSEELKRATANAYSDVATLLKSIDSQEIASVNINTAWALVHGLSQLINNNLLTIDERGNPTHALLSRGSNPTTKEISNQVAAAISTFIKGLSS